MSSSSAIPMLGKGNVTQWRLSTKNYLQTMCPTVTEFTMTGELPTAMPYGDKADCVVNLPLLKRSINGAGQNEDKAIPMTITMGPADFVLLDGTKLARQMVAQAQAKSTQSFENGFTSNGIQACGIMMMHIPNGIRNILMMNPLFEKWVNSGRSDHVMNEACTKLTMDASDGTGDAVQSNFQTQHQIQNLLNMKQGSQSYANYLDARQIVMDSLMNLRYDHAAWDNPLALSFLLSLNGDFQEYIKKFEVDGEAKKDLTLAKAQEIARTWNAHRERMQQIRPDQGPSGPGSTTARKTEVMKLVNAALAAERKKKSPSKGEKGPAGNPPGEGKSSAAKARAKRAAEKAGDVTANATTDGKKETCLLHGYDKGHSTDECLELKASPAVKKALLQAAADRKAFYAAKRA